MSALNTYRKYSQHDPSSWTRMDMLLALYDGMLDRLNKAELCLNSDEESLATQLLVRVQLILSELAAGVRLEVDQEMGVNMLRLYEFVSHRLREPSLEGIQDARRILATLREGFDAIRPEANRMERAGQLPAADRLPMVCTTA